MPAGAPGARHDDAQVLPVNAVRLQLGADGSDGGAAVQAHKREARQRVAVHARGAR